MIESEKRHKKNAISEQEIDEEVINIPRAIEVVGNLNLVKEMLKMLVDTMPEYRQTIAEMFKKKDYTAVSAVAHKLLGAACYCGTIRLDH